MGLILIQAQFRGGAPEASTFREAVRALLGSTNALDAVESEQTLLNVTLLPDAIAQAYITKAIVDLGGECIDSSGNVTRSSGPRYVERPWRQWPLWKRAIFRVRG